MTYTKAERAAVVCELIQRALARLGANADTIIAGQIAGTAAIEQGHSAYRAVRHGVRIGRMRLTQPTPA